MSDERKFRCDYCDSPCILIMEGIGGDDDDIVVPICCPYDGSKSKNYWYEVTE